MKPSWSVVVIAKNETKTLPRLVQSLNEFKKRGGEICVLDTGSTDGTAQLARDLGCVVEEVGEKYVVTIDKETADAINARFIVGNETPIVKEGDRFFDYGKARNHAASLASNDIVSMPDCDEMFTRLDLDHVEAMIAEGWEQFEFQFVFAHDPWGNEAIKFVQCKMYDRRKMKWEGIIHELLVGSAKRMLFAEDKFKIEHYQNHGSNRSHYLVGLAYDCFQHPDNDRNSHYLARELFWHKRNESAIQEFKRHLTMKGWAAERSESLIFMGDAYGNLNMPERQAECYFSAFHLDSSRRAALIKLAQFYRHNNNPKATAAYAAAAMEIPWSPFYANDLSHYQHIPHELLYWAKGWLGDIPAARMHLMEALKYQPSNAQYLHDTQFYFEYGAPKVEGWMTFEELTFLYETAKALNGKKIVELGSWKGRSTHALLTGNKEGTVTAVDTWDGSVDPRDDTNRLAKQEDVFATFNKNVGHFPNLVTVRKSGMEAYKDFEDNSIDFMFIDAGHTYEEVKEDIQAWLPKVKPGGIISGHDYMPQTWMGVCQAVDELIGPVNLAGSIWWKPVDEVRVNKIPKKIFSIWLSEDGKVPEKIQKIIDTQKIEGYEHTLITLENCPKDTEYVNVAIAAKKWVKAADYLKMWLIHTYGGIVLDADMEMLPGKNFDKMLHRSMFAGQEENGFVGFSLVGGQVKHPLTQEFLKVVPEKFKGDDDLNFESSMEIFTQLALSRKYDITIYPPHYFFPYNHQTGKIVVTEATVAFHHFLKSWTNVEDLLPTVSIIIPQLGREEGLKKCLESIDRLYYPKHLVEVIVEEGPETVPVKVKNALAKSGGSIIVYMANDTVMTPYSLYYAIKESEEQDKGLVAFNTGEIYPDEGNICEHFIIDRLLIEKLGGEIFDTSFHHVGVDNLLWKRAKQMNEAIRSEKAVVEHNHFSKGAEMDEVYKKGWQNADADRALLNEKIKTYGI